MKASQRGRLIAMSRREIQCKEVEASEQNLRQLGKIQL